MLLPSHTPQARFGPTPQLRLAARKLNAISPDSKIMIYSDFDRPARKAQHFLNWVRICDVVLKSDGAAELNDWAVSEPNVASMSIFTIYRLGHEVNDSYGYGKLSKLLTFTIDKTYSAGMTRTCSVAAL